MKLFTEVVFQGYDLTFSLFSQCFRTEGFDCFNFITIRAWASIHFSHGLSKVAF